VIGGERTKFPRGGGGASTQLTFASRSPQTHPSMHQPRRRRGICPSQILWWDGCGRAESEFVKGHRSRFSAGSHRCLPPPPVEVLLCLSIYAQPRKYCRMWPLARGTSKSVEAVALNASNTPSSAANRIPNMTEVGPTEINGYVNGRSCDLVSRF
jgi:hypothetical protein